MTVILCIPSRSAQWKDHPQVQWLWILMGKSLNLCEVMNVDRWRWFHSLLQDATDKPFSVSLRSIEYLTTNKFCPWKRMTCSTDSPNAVAMIASAAISVVEIRDIPPSNWLIESEEDKCFVTIERFNLGSICCNSKAQRKLLIKSLQSKAAPLNFPFFTNLIAFALISRYLTEYQRGELRDPAKVIN